MQYQPACSLSLYGTHPPSNSCLWMLATLFSALSPLRWHVKLRASYVKGLYKRKHRLW